MSAALRVDALPRAHLGIRAGGGLSSRLRFSAATLGSCGHPLGPCSPPALGPSPPPGALVPLSHANGHPGFAHGVCCSAGAALTWSL